MTSTERPTAGWLVDNVFVPVMRQSAMRLSKLDGPNCSAEANSSVPSAYDDPPGGATVGCTLYQKPPTSVDGTAMSLPASTAVTADAPVLARANLSSA